MICANQTLGGTMFRYQYVVVLHSDPFKEPNIICLSSQTADTLFPSLLSCQFSFGPLVCKIPVFLDYCWKTHPLLDVWTSIKAGLACVVALETLCFFTATIYEMAASVAAALEPKFPSDGVAGFFAAGPTTMDPSYFAVAGAAKGAFCFSNLPNSRHVKNTSSNMGFANIPSRQPASLLYQQNSVPRAVTV
jgi:hypothetical protein